MLLFLLLTVLTPAAALFPTHGWGSGSEMLWADWSPNADSADWPLSQAALADVAGRYRVHSLEQCFGCSWSSSPPCTATEAHIVATAAGLKASAAAAGAPTPTVLMYIQGSMPRSCYASNSEYMSHPEWFLRFDAHAWAGQPVRRNPANPSLDDNTFLNYLNASARAWWGQQAWALPGAAQVIDGFFSDSTGYMDYHDRYAANVSWELTYALNNATLQMLAEAKALGYPAIMYNGLADSSKYAPDWNEGALAVTDGANIEHWGAFECITPSGAMNTSMFSALILQAYARGNDSAGKGVFIKAWPGPVTAPIFFLPQQEWGPHRMTPSWPGNSTPLTPAARSAAMLLYFPYAYATFLMAAGPRSYLHYAWWYDLCDGTSAVCRSGSAWADLSPWLSRPLGAPLGPPALSPDGVTFQRSFEGVNVTVDLSDWHSAKFQWSA